MPELIAHLFGDYVFQNHWMAQNKVRSWCPAVVHATIYTSMFLFLTHDPTSLAIIGGTHLLIDRFRLARLWVEFWGVGNTGILWQPFRRDAPIERAPDWLSVWLLIIVDNSIHLAINHFALSL